MLKRISALPSTDRGLGIDLLRTISIALVIVYHYELVHLTLSGVHGVMIFFMISGFCMAYSMQNRSGREFLEARFWRLIPTFVVCVTITVVIKWTTHAVYPERAVNVASYLINLVCMPSGLLVCDVVHDVFAGKSPRFSWIDGVYWSLLVEIRFYLLLWLLHYILKVRHIAWVIAGLGLLAPFNGSTELISKSQDFFIYLPFFAFGIAYSDITKKVPYARGALLFSFLVFSANAHFNSTAISMYLNMKNYASFASCFAVFLTVMVLCANRTNRYITYAGILSYPLYLLHQDIGLILIKFFGTYLPTTAAALIVIGLMVLLADAVQKWTDKRQARLRKRMTASRT